MGAVPGGSFLKSPGRPAAPGAFDVEPFRTAGRRVVLREVDRPTVVLGSTQKSSVVDAGRATRNGVAIVRRRSGGGAVLLLPGAQIWADLWVPRGDPLWSAEPGASAVVAGEWWARALGAPGTPAAPGALRVQRGAPAPGSGSALVCFAGVGPGEVTCGGRKVVGLAQWRSREGVLVHGCAYRRWHPAPLVDLLAVPAARRVALNASLRDAAIGFEELEMPSWGVDDLLRALPDAGSWDVRTG